MPSKQTAVATKCRLIVETIKAWAGINDSVGKFRELLTQLQQTGFKIGRCKTAEYKAAMLAIKHAYPKNKQSTYLNYMYKFKKLLSQPLPATGNVSITSIQNSRLKLNQAENTVVIFPDFEEDTSAAAAADAFSSILGNN